jgi:hypothetical protein
MNKLKFFVLLLFIGAMVSCKSNMSLTNKVYLSDAEMALALKKIEKSENAFLIYREGASGANGGKGGGGCGCN